MIGMRSLVTGEVQIVESVDGYDQSWETLPELPTDGDLALLVFVGDVWTEDLGPLEASLHARIDEEAGAYRSRFITTVAGQQLTYQRKESEARAWIGASTHDPADYPFIGAEAAATGLDPNDVAASIVAAADSWAAIGSAIEGARIAAKRAVSAAPTSAAMRVAALVDWEGLEA